MNQIIIKRVVNNISVNSKFDEEHRKSINLITAKQALIFFISYLVLIIKQNKILVINFLIGLLLVYFFNILF